MHALLKSTLDGLMYFHPWPEEDGVTAIPYVWDAGEVPLCLVLGPNGGGKSFFRRLIRLVAREEWKDTECIHLSMESRTGTNSYGPMQVLIYGNEGVHSTGELSANVVRTGIHTCQGRSKEHFIYWDEPGIGMGENEAAGTGQMLREFISNLPEMTRAVFITSHSRAMLHELVSLRPHYLHLGVNAEDAPQSLTEWLERPVVPVLPDDLRDASRERFKTIQSILNHVNKEEDA